MSQAQAIYYLQSHKDKIPVLAAFLALGDDEVKLAAEKWIQEGTEGRGIRRLIMAIARHPDFVALIRIVQ